jgi:hypothetical protein
MKTVLFYVVLVIGVCTALLAFGTTDPDERTKGWLAALTCLVVLLVLVYR